MPLHVDIRLNDKVIERLHIGRILGTEEEDSENTYFAILGEYPAWAMEWADGSYFTHRYGDGALKCIERAIAAIYNPEQDLSEEKVSKIWNSRGHN
jgi:hypothetical protein